MSTRLNNRRTLSIIDKETSIKNTITQLKENQIHTF